VVYSCNLYAIYYSLSITRSAYPYSLYLDLVVTS